MGIPFFLILTLSVGRCSDRRIGGSFYSFGAVKVETRIRSYQVIHYKLP